MKRDLLLVYDAETHTHTPIPFSSLSSPILTLPPCLCMYVSSYTLITSMMTTTALIKEINNSSESNNKPRVGDLCIQFQMQEHRGSGKLMWL